MDPYTKSSRHASIEKGGGFRVETGTNGNSSIEPVGNWTTDYVDTLSGYRNPKWRDEVRLLQNATTQLTAVRYNVDAPYCSFGFDADLHNAQGSFHRSVSQRWNGSVNFVRIIGFPGPADSSVISRVRNAALSKFLSKAQNVLSAFEAGQDLGEYKETLNTIVRPFHSARVKTVSYLESLLKAKRRYRGHIPTLKRVLADSYLEWHFGVSPLVSDIASAIADAKRTRLPVYPITASAHERYSGTASSTSFTPVGYSGMSGNVKVGYNSYGTYTVRYKGLVRSGADPSGKIGILQDWQFLPSDWLPTAWDLLPWSWAADFFTNVGDIIRGLSFVRANLAWWFMTTRQEETLTVGSAEVSNTGMSPPFPSGIFGSYKTISNGATSTSSKVTVSRSIPSSFWDLVPTVELRLPHTKYQFADLAAALFARYERLLPFF